MAKRTSGGVQPYPSGRQTTGESIEAGEQREEIASGLKKARAIEAGRALRARMKGQGWRLCVWQNLGWHYKVSRGALAVYAHHDYRGTVTYTTLMDDAVPKPGRSPNAGALVFSYTRQRPFLDPNEAVAGQLRKAKTELLRLAHAIISAEGARRLVWKTTVARG